MRLLFIVLRLIVAASIATAIIGQLVHSLSRGSSIAGFDAGFTIVNFFSFFTIDSNVASAVVLVIGAVFAIVRRDTANPFDPAGFTVARAAVATYMITTGIVYNLLLRGIALPQGQTLEWSNEILHVIAPLFILLDWLVAPGRTRLSYRTIWAIVVFPIVWLVYTLIRGLLAIDALTGKPWYPYPFLNPASFSAGYVVVAGYVVAIAVGICAIGFGVVWVSRRGAPEDSALHP